MYSIPSSLIALEAYNSRILTSWLAAEVVEAASHHGTQRLTLAAQAAWALHSWYCELEKTSRYLKPEDPSPRVHDLILVSLLVKPCTCLEPHQTCIPTCAHQEASSLLDLTLLHLRTYAALANLAANAGEIFVQMLSILKVVQLLYTCVYAFLHSSNFEPALRLAWQIRPKHHIYHHIGLDMRDQLYSCRFFHCFRDEAAMQYGKRCFNCKGQGLGM